MARSSLLVVIGLLVASIAVPVFGQYSEQKFNFCPAFGNGSTWYTGYDSPAYANGDETTSDTLWNACPTFGQGNGWIDSNGGHAGDGLHAANNSAPTAWYADGIKFEGGFDFNTDRGATALQLPHGWQTGYAGMTNTASYDYDYNGAVWNQYTGQPTRNEAGDIVRPWLWSLQKLAGNCIQVTGVGDWGVRVGNLQPGKYRVYSIHIDPNNSGWLTDVSIGTNLPGPLANPDRVGCTFEEDEAGHWVLGKNYDMKEITITSTSDWASIILSPVATADGLQAQYPGYAYMNGFQIIKLPDLIKGDADGNGKVNFDDYLVLESSFGTNVTKGTGADFDGNGTVNFDDYLVLEANFGTGTAVPEPMTMSLLGLGALALIRRRQA